jgi:hypothetical protein
MWKKMISFLCNAPCHWVGEHIEYCKQIEIIENEEDNMIWTWRPQTSFWVYLIKANHHTLVYVPCEDNVFFVNPMFCLKQECPSTSIFFCQCIQDTEDTHPKLLVMDIICELGKNCSKLLPEKRYKTLMSYAQYFPVSFIEVQWCGHKTALSSEFFNTLPHKVQSVIGIGPKTGSLYMKDL